MTCRETEITNNTQHLPCAKLCSNILTYWSSSQSSRVGTISSHIPNEETEAQKGYVIWLKSLVSMKLVSETALGLESKLLMVNASPYDKDELPLSLPTLQVQRSRTELLEVSPHPTSQQWEILIQ